jgi:uncharacterized damage-inducible protein DinB
MSRPLGFPLGDALALVEYNRAVFDRFARRIRRLPRRGAFRKRGLGHESFFDTLVHILNVHEVWLVYIVRGRNSDRELEALFQDLSRHPDDWRKFDAYARRVWDGVEETLRPLTPRDLGRKVKAFWMPGTYTLRDALWQTTFEQAHHLGELIGALWQQDIEPPEMTWIDTRRGLAARARAR